MKGINKIFSALLTATVLSNSAMASDCSDKSYRAENPDECSFFIGTTTLTTFGSLAAVGGALAFLGIASAAENIDNTPRQIPTPTVTAYMVGDDIDELQLASIRGNEAYVLNSDQYDEIRLAWSLARGFTGSGSKIAIMDAGDDTWHGPTVENFAHGPIAPNADVTRYQVTSHGTNILPYQEIANVFASVTDTNIYNNSWNSGIPATSIYTRAQFTEMTHPDFVSQIINITTEQDAIFVWAAGNNGMSQSGFLSAMPLVIEELQGHFVNVVAWDSETGALADFSNQCGVTQNYCITAPGAHLNTGKTSADGTSFAAPLVSAAIAVLREAFPYMQSTQITELLFETARDLGTPGTDAVYGRGMLDLERATRPVGVALIPLENEQMVPLQPARVSGTIARNIQGTGLQFAYFDKYGRAFTTKLDENIQIQNPGRAFERLRHDSVVQSAKLNNIEFGFRKTDLALGNNLYDTAPPDLISFIGTNNKFNIGDTELFQHIELGFSAPNNDHSSVISSFSKIYTASATFGARRGNWTLSLSIPDTIIHGQMNMHLPVGRAADGAILYSNASLDLLSLPSFEYSVSYKYLTASFIDNPVGTDEFFVMAKKTIRF